MSMHQIHSSLMWNFILRRSPLDIQINPSVEKDQKMETFYWKRLRPILRILSRPSTNHRRLPKTLVPQLNIRCLFTEQHPSTIVEGRYRCTLLPSRIKRVKFYRKQRRLIQLHRRRRCCPKLSWNIRNILRKFGTY